MGMGPDAGIPTGVGSHVVFYYIIDGSFHNEDCTPQTLHLHYHRVNDSYPMDFGVYEIHGVDAP